MSPADVLRDLAATSEEHLQDEPCKVTYFVLLRTSPSKGFGTAADAASFAI